MKREYMKKGMLLRKENSTSLYRVLEAAEKRALGRETVEMIVQREKSLEEAQKMQNRGKKRKIDRWER